MKLSDLGDTFFKDLREGNFVLILGAGFSYGIRNQIQQHDVDEINRLLVKAKRKTLDFDSCKNIPISEVFVQITNTLFGKKIKKYNFRDAANAWSSKKANYQLEGTDISFFIRNLFLPDKNYIRENINLVKNIFIPNWHNIYTLNFDTVLEEIIDIADLQERYKIYAYPNAPGFETRSLQTNIGHLHNVITSDQLDSMVFADPSYHILTDAKQSLYDNLHTDLLSGKKVLILGTQLGEDDVQHKLFHDVTPKEVFHFDLSHNSIKEKPFINETNLFPVTLKEKDEKGTRLFLKFLGDNRSTIQNVDLKWTKLIDKRFRQAVEMKGDEIKFKAADFYTARKSGQCQWYGIIKEWDVKRSRYKELKNKVIEAVNLKYLDERIIARVYGRGGSGKSTMLRRLALDLCEEDFTVLWVDEESILYYSDNHNEIAAYAQHKILFFFEDCFSLKYRGKYDLSEIINELHTFENFRIIIGDRDENLEDISQHFFQPLENRFELKPSENQKILDQILSSNKEWKRFALSKLTPQFINQSTLFLILFIIGRSKEIKNNQFKDPFSYFHDIIGSDLKKIALHYPGYAIALYYYANIFEKGKLTIEPSFFELMASEFSGSPVTPYRHLPENIRSLLEIYLNRSAESGTGNENTELLTFNHDVLAEKGISKVSISINHFEPFCDGVAMRILDLAITHGKYASKNGLLYYALINISNESFPSSHKLKYVLKQFNLGFYGSYLEAIYHKKLKLSTEQKRLIARDLIKLYFDNVMLPESTVALSLLEFKDSYEGIIFANRIFRNFLISGRYTKILVTAFKLYFYDYSEVSLQAARKILDDYIIKRDINAMIITGSLQALIEFNDQGLYDKAMKLVRDYINHQYINFDVMSLCLLIVGEQQEQGEEVAGIILTQYLKALEKNADERSVQDYKLLFNDFPFICGCLQIVKDTKFGIDTAQNILKLLFAEKDKSLFIKEIVNNCLKILRQDVEKGETIVNQILHSFTEYDKDIVCGCISFLRFTDHKGADFAKNILNRFINNEDFNKEIICNCLHNLRDSNEKGLTEVKTILDKHLYEKPLKAIDEVIISSALRNLYGTPDGTYYAALFINRENVPWCIIHQSLFNFSKVKSPPAQMVTKVKQIIENKYNSPNAVFRFMNLLMIPLHNVAPWKNATQEIIRDFRSRNSRTWIFNVLKSYRTLPDEITDACAFILEHWETELKIKFVTAQQRKRQRIPYRGCHIEVALGHPYLHELAEKTRLEIIKAKEENRIRITKDIYSRIKSGEALKWKIAEDDEPDTEESESAGVYSTA